MFNPTSLEMAKQYRSEQIRAAEQSRLAAEFKPHRMRRAVGALSNRIGGRRRAFALVSVPDAGNATSRRRYSRPWALRH